MLRTGGGRGSKSSLRLARSCNLLDDPSKSSVVLDREPDQEKGLDPSGPRMRCLLCGWSPRRRRTGVQLGSSSQPLSEVVNSCPQLWFRVLVKQFTYGKSEFRTFVTD